MLQIPKNVMQIGQSSPHCKIYVEDYVHTFLKQRKKEEVYLAFGKKEEISGVLYYLIYGAEKKTDWDRGSLPYFKKYDRIGTLEGTAEKRLFRPVRQEAISLDGYFVFYEQNEDMQSYMITVREKEDQQQEKEAEKEEVLEAVRLRREAGRDRPNQEDMDRRQQYQRDRMSGRHTSVKTKKQRRNAAASFRLSRLPKINKVSWSVPQICRVASVCLLMVLAVAGITSMNGYTGLKDVGHFIGDTVKNLKALGKSDTVVSLDQTDKFIFDDEGFDDNNNFIIEEIQITDNSENLNLTEEQNEQAGQKEDTIQWTIGEETEESVENKPVNTPETVEEFPDKSVQESTVVTQKSAETAQGNTELAEASAETAQENTEVQEVSAEVSERPENYIVQRGDSLAEICRRFYGDTSRMYEICSLNKIKDPNQIRYGQNILLP